MKCLKKTLIVLSLAYAITTASSFAQVFTFDENGNNNLSGFGPVPVHFGLDPSGGLAANVLYYTLPFAVTPGDVALFELPPATSTNSDLVRFFTVAGGNTSDVIFYSDIEPGEPKTDLADTGIPFSPNAITIQETGTEGNNGAVWTPPSGAPGSFPAGNITYDIISDAPEPGTWALTACGGLALALLKWRRQSRA